MNEYSNMFSELPEPFHRVPFLDRIHGFIKGWDLPRMNDDLKAFGWALNSEYFSGIMHQLRDDASYRAIVDIPVDCYGVVRPETLKDTISYNTKLVSIMFANNEIGPIEPIRELCDIAHQHGALFHTDAVQAIGHVKVDVKDLGIDMLSASAHKFNGPKGVGFLYLKSKTPLTPYVDGGAQEFGMRAGTENVASIVAMAVALEKSCRRIDDATNHLLALEEVLLDDLQKAGIDFIRNGSANKIPGILSLSFKHAQGEMLLHRLDLMGISVSTGSACDSQNTQLSHVLSAINVLEEYGYGTIRISFGHENTIEESRYIAAAIIKILK